MFFSFLFYRRNTKKQKKNKKQHFFPFKYSFRSDNEYTSMDVKYLNDIIQNKLSNIVQIRCEIITNSLTYYPVINYILSGIYEKAYINVNS